MALQAYFDDSGTKGTGRILLVGGLIGEAQVMAEVADLWDKELRSRVPLPIRYFKAYEAQSFTGEFKDWRVEARNEKVFRLMEIIDRADLFWIPGAVDLGGHKQLEAMAGKTIDAKWNPFNQPYMLALIDSCLAVGLESQRTPLRQRTEIIIDEHVVFRSEVNKMYEQLLEVVPPWMQRRLPLQLLFRDDQDFVLLQAADLMQGNARMIVEKAEGWPVKEMNHLTASPFSNHWSPERLGNTAARHIEKRLGLPKDTLRVSVKKKE